MEEVAQSLNPPLLHVHVFLVAALLVAVPPGPPAPLALRGHMAERAGAVGLCLHTVRQSHAHRHHLLPVLIVTELAHQVQHIVRHAAPLLAHLCGEVVLNADVLDHL